MVSPIPVVSVKMNNECIALTPLACTTRKTATPIGVAPPCNKLTPFKLVLVLRYATDVLYLGQLLDLPQFSPAIENMKKKKRRKEEQEEQEEQEGEGKEGEGNSAMALNEAKERVCFHDFDFRYMQHAHTHASGQPSKRTEWVSAVFECAARPNCSSYFAFLPVALW
jgi:hypothetical protein